MLISFDALAQQFAGYTDVKGKIRREVQGGRLVQVARGLYETDARIDGKYLAGAIYGPSYLSFDYALSVHALIPEAVYGTLYFGRRSKKARLSATKTPSARFCTATFPAAVYPARRGDQSGGGIFLSDRLARKALCDKLVFAFASVFGEGAQMSCCSTICASTKPPSLRCKRTTSYSSRRSTAPTNLKLLAKFINRN